MSQYFYFCKAKCVIQTKDEDSDASSINVGNMVM